METVQATAASTIRVLVHRTLRFYDDAGECSLPAWTLVQHMPARFLDNAYFQAAKESGWIEVVPEPQPVVVAPYGKGPYGGSLKVETKPQPEPALTELKQQLKPQEKGDGK